MNFLPYTVLAPDTVAYPNQTHEYIRERINKLILGQHAFRYGLIYFALLVVLHIFSISYGRVHSAGDGAVPGEQQTKLLRLLLSSQDESLKAVAGGIKEIKLLHQMGDETIKKQHELEKRIDDLSRSLSAMRKASITQGSAKGKNKAATIQKDGSTSKR